MKSSEELQWGLGAMIGSFMKMSAQCFAAAKKANQMLRTARKETKRKTDDIVMLLCKLVVCLYLNTVYIL